MDHLFNKHLGNIFMVYARSDKEDREFGMNAYENYHDRIRRIVEDSEPQDGGFYDVSAGCGIFAALSPNIDEAANFLALERLLNGYPLQKIAGYPANKEKALRIMRGTSPLTVLSGSKTRAFYQNLFKPSDLSNALVIDAHIYSVWTMRRFKVQETPKINDELYKRISRDVAQVAFEIDIRPNQLQSILWSTWKRVNNIVFDSQRKLPI